MDLLESHHGGGVRFEPVEWIEDAPRIAVRFGWDGWKVFSFAWGRVVLLRDCLDREDAVAQLAGR